MQNIWIFSFGVFALMALAESASVRPGKEEVLKTKVTCDGNGDYNTYDPDDCSMYYHCSNGQPQHMDCGWFKRFDEASNSCTVKWWLIGSADCSKVKPVEPTPTPSSGTSSPTSAPNNGGSTSPTKKASSAPINGISATLSLFFLVALCVIS